MSKPFWRDAYLTENETELLHRLYAAHHASALRNNMSCQAVQIAWQGSGDYGKSIAAGLMTLGNRHAPVEKICEVLGEPAACARIRLNQGCLIPGWGNSFVKGGPDLIWEEVNGWLEQSFPDMANRMEEITVILHRAGKVIYPNPGCYTAATALILGLPAHLSPYLFLSARLDAWTSLMRKK